MRWLLRDEGVAWILEKVDEKVEAITYDGRKGMGGDECEAVTQAKIMLFRPLEKSPTLRCPASTLIALQVVRQGARGLNAPLHVGPGERYTY